jgi:hypothetical protein
MGKNHLQREKNRDQYLTGLGVKVLRFDSRVVLTETDAVMEVIYRTITERLNSEIPPIPPEGVKKSPYHPHPGPPPSRGREFLLVF